jgi:hypothetical protein
VAASTPQVVLDNTLQPSSDVTQETLSESTLTLRVVEDRGLVAKSNGRLSNQPTTVVIRQEKTHRYITGSRTEDGSFPVELQLLRQVGTATGPDGQQRALGGSSPLNGMVLHAIVERSGAIRSESTRIVGVDPALAATLQPMMVSILQQLSSMQPLVLNANEPAHQDVKLQIPVPVIGGLDVDMKIAHRLLSVDDGLARIQQTFTLQFNISPATNKGRLTAQGTGGGQMVYDTLNKRVNESESVMLMKFSIESPDGLLEMQSTAKESAKARTTQPSGQEPGRR